MYCDNVNKKTNNFYTTARCMTLFKIKDNVLILYKPFNKSKSRFPILNASSQDSFFIETRQWTERTILIWSEMKQSNSYMILRLESFYAVLFINIKCNMEIAFVLY